MTVGLPGVIIGLEQICLLVKDIDPSSGEQ